MEKLEVQTGQKKEVAVYNEQKFYQIAEKVAKDLCVPQNEVPLIKQKAMSFYLAFKQVPNADKCTSASIEAAFRQALQSKLDLSNLKAQAYLIVYGNVLQFQPSYRGRKRNAYENNTDIVPGSIRSQCVMKGDVFVSKILPNAREVLIKHERPDLDKRSDEIIGAYAAVTHKDKSTEIIYMNISEIRKCWAKSRSNGQTHKEFPISMAKKTVEAKIASYLSGDSGDNEDYDDITYNDNKNETPTYDINTDETENVIEVNESDIAKVEETNEVPENATVVDGVEIISDSNNEKEEDTFEIPYTEYLNDKTAYEKIEYYKDKKTILVRKRQ